MYKKNPRNFELTVCIFLCIQKDVKCTMRELVKVEEKYKGPVIGRKGAKLQEICNQTGAKVIFSSEDAEFYIIRGTEEQRKHAKAIIGEIVVGVPVYFPLCLSELSELRC